MSACKFQVGIGEDRTWFGRCNFILYSLEPPNFAHFRATSADTQRGGGRPKRSYRSHRPPARTDLLVVPFAARRFRFRRQIHQLFGEPRILTEEETVGNKRLYGGHGPSTRR